MMTFKPMLAGTLKDVSLLRFPLLASQKLDGIRATVQGGRLLSRTLKPIPNVNAQGLFRGLAEGLDGELIVGDPFAPDAFRKTTSLVMSDDKPLEFFNEPLRYHVFDKFSNGLTFVQRLAEATLGVIRFNSSQVQVVPHLAVHAVSELDVMEAALLCKGAEGVMLRLPSGPYKEGRSTEREGYLIKVKRFEDSEAEVLEAHEEQENTNEATTNELGRTKRSSAKAGKVGKGILGVLTGRDLKTGVEFNMSGFTLQQKIELWAEREALVGRIAKYKFFPSGGKDKPRHPIFLGWRSKEDM
jgi:DNA ligase-1